MHNIVKGAGTCRSEKPGASGSILGAALMALAAISSASVQAAQSAGIAFVHNDWEIACDNTRTCRAAGYHSESSDDSDVAPLPVSVLLTRQAGPGAQVDADLQIGSLEDDDPGDGGSGGAALVMRINGRPAGKVRPKKDGVIYQLAPQQTAQMLAALAGHSRIEWSDGKRTWRLSDKGATAVLLKMDEFQGRLGTPSALVRKGAKDDNGVLPAVPMPVVHAAPVPSHEPVQLPKVSLQALQASLKTSMQECSDAGEGAPQAELVVQRLSATKLLASTTCWTGAYNQGTAFWVINAVAPFAPELVTTSGSDFSDSTIIASQKGRGIGDCWSFEQWTWDGKRFVGTSKGTSGMCKSIAPGGAWSLPVLVADVRRPAAPRR